MSPTALAIVGLFFWIWSHEFAHTYSVRPTRYFLFGWVGLAVIASACLLTALITAISA